MIKKGCYIMKNEKSYGIIVEHNGKILIVQQKKSGNYGFPKGHILPNETEEECAIREVKEETNIDVEINKKNRYSLSYVQDGNINKEVVYFIGKPKNSIEEKKQEKEISSILWIDIDKVRDTLTYDNLKEIWDQVIKDISV